MKKLVLIISMLLLLCVSACGLGAKDADWGSFSPDRTESFDHRYYAIQTVADSQVKVTVYDCDSDTEVFSFIAARASDFWGVCWEPDSYNIWIQSGDIGVFCYRYENNEWALDENMKRPASIISKYDS